MCSISDNDDFNKKISPHMLPNSIKTYVILITINSAIKGSLIIMG